MKKIITLFLSVILVIGALSLTACGGSKKSENLNEANLNITPGESNGVGIVTLASDTVVTETERYLEKTLQATVSGSEVNRKPLDLNWSLMWLEDNSGNINDYLTLTVDTEDSSICYVRLYDVLESTAVIYVECKNNLVSASCMVEYSGKVRSIYVYDENLNELYDEENNIYYYELIQGNEYNVSFGAFGFFDDYLNSYKDFEIICEGFGDFYVSKYGIESNPKVLTNLSSYVNVTNTWEDYDNHTSGKGYMTYLNYSLSDGLLTINAKTALENLGYKSGLLSYHYVSLKEDSIVPYVQFTIKCGGITETINFRITTDVTLSLDNSNIMFE